MKLKIVGARLAFPKLFTPEAFQGEGAECYSCALIVPTKNFKAFVGEVGPDGKIHYHTKQIALDVAVDQVGKEKWKDKWPAIKKTTEQRDSNCLHNGDLKADLAGYAGNYYINCRAQSDQRPSIRDTNGTPLTERDGRIYGGCYVVALIEMWAMDNQFGKKVNAQVRGVQFLRTGDAFGAGAPAQDDEFDDVSEGADAGDFGSDDDDDDIG